MKTLQFTGYSDDTLCEISGHSGFDADNCGKDAPIVALVASPSAAHGLIVCAHYGPQGIPDMGVWVLGVGPIGESVGLAPWPVRLTQGGGRLHTCSYSPVLEVDAPDDVEVVAWEGYGGLLEQERCRELMDLICNGR